MGRSRRHAGIGTSTISGLPREVVFEASRAGFNCSVGTLIGVEPPCQGSLCTGSTNLCTTGACLVDACIGSVVALTCSADISIRIGSMNLRPADVCLIYAGDALLALSHNSDRNTRHVLDQLLRVSFNAWQQGSGVTANAVWLNCAR